MEPLKGILFIDIETVPVQPDYNWLSADMQKEWNRKARLIKGIAADENADPALLFGERAGIYSEFAKVVCIGIGSLHQQDGKWKMRLKSLTNNNEHELLKDFCELLTRFEQHNKEVKFCGHNIKEFDIPFLCRRMIIAGMGIPNCMQFQGKKPWEISHLDTMELWKFGDYKNFTSLSLLAAVLGIPSPKTDLDGSMVASVYWQEKDLPRIASYCLQDVYTSAKVYLRLTGVRGLDPEAVYVDV